MTKEEVYDEQINPLMAQVIAICKEHKIPVVASFCLDCDEGLHCTTTLLDDEYEPSEGQLAASREIMRSRSSFAAITITRTGEDQ